MSKNILFLHPFTFLFCLIQLCHTVWAYQILGVFPAMSKSHWIVGSSLMKGLAKSGHNVTVLSPFTLSEPVENYREIEISGIEQAIESVRNVVNISRMSTFQFRKAHVKFGQIISNHTLRHEKMQQFLKNRNEQFDVIILDVFMDEAILGLGLHFNAPIIGLSTCAANKWSNEMVGTPLPLSYLPSNFNLNFGDGNSFWNRLRNVCNSILQDFHFEFTYMSVQSDIYNEIFPDPKPPLWILRKNVSLVLVNSHFSIGTPKPYVPNMIEVGGLHLNKNNRKLPMEIQQFLDEATEGVVYFSLGGNVKSTLLDEKRKQAIIAALSKIKQRVLWKWDDHSIANLSNNILIRDWLPQNDVLAHPNIKAFVSHGGFLSIIESVYHGVPVVGIPVFGDQGLNVKIAVKQGYAIMVDFHTLSENSLYEAIEKVLSDGSYMKNIKMISEIYRDQPIDPLNLAIYWTEYVARYKGAFHMRSAGQDLFYFQYYNIDVYAVLLVTTVLSVFMSIKIFCFAFCRKSRKPVKKCKQN